jgi:hypothetical protein
MRKILMFDLEHGSQSLGSKDTITKEFKLPVLSPGSWDQFLNTMASLYTQKAITKKIKIGDTEIEEHSKEVVLKNGTQIDAVCIDTFSELSKKYVRELSDSSGKMKLNSWGMLKSKLDGCLEFITRIPGIVICLCHSRIQTMDDGNKVMPLIDGSTKEDISKWFDFVFYTAVEKDSEGVRNYIWITKRDEKYDHAKDRTDTLDETIPQDFQLVLAAAKEKGWSNTRVLIIGSPGSGKTRSLATLVNNEGGSDENNNS